jgi:hypothetical protein
MAYNRLIADAVCELVSMGISITKACATVGIPRSTYASWVFDDIDGQAARSARAIEMGCDVLADQLIEIADTPMQMHEVTESPTGRTVVTKEALGHRRLMIDTRLRLMGQWTKKYSPKSQVDQKVSGGVVVLKATPEDEAL